MRRAVNVQDYRLQKVQEKTSQDHPDRGSQREANAQCAESDHGCREADADEERPKEALNHEVDESVQRAGGALGEEAGVGGRLERGPRLANVRPHLCEPRSDRLNLVALVSLQTAALLVQN